ncbi:aspartyl/asparaginyl beta-hydroxylase domain-containing protein [Tateyamaria pelophila]|uniref:aspartyl/asparaginyl beta-hydroxylase domain-containing protein n=1 Tax=Tateyamaria pelophila TaxID=328415 RepID=UPI001CBE0CE5|nr:aspartyl/asparaginyl beta-hydroxylase domain-containing protein [Tateyamaria pelophila]
MSQTTTAAPRKKPVNSWFVRFGKRQRKWINPYIKRHSKVGDAAVFDRSNFEWIDALEANWEAIRDEALAVLKNREGIPPLAQISPDHKGLDDQNKWRSFFLWGYGFRVDQNCARCPQTTAALKNVPGLRTAMFSIHAPGMAIPPHKGVTAGMCVFHLGLKVPKDTANCAIRVENEIVHWQDGEGFVFDDTKQHETWNRTDDERVILLVQFDRPLRFPGNVVASLFFQAIRRTSFVGNARRQLGDWEDTFRKFEKADE